MKKPTLKQLVETRLKGLRARELRILLWVLSHARGGESTAPLQTIADSMGGSFADIQRARKRLEAEGILERVSRNLKGEIVFRINIAKV